MLPSTTATALAQLLASRPVVELADITEALGGVSVMTAFRHLRRVPYRRSYNHNGRYYAHHAPDRYDRHGLWSHGDIHFSRLGSLKETVRRMVHDGEAGATQRELADRLRVRVHNTLLGLFRSDEVGREKVEGNYLYFHSDPKAGREQLDLRLEQLAAAAQAQIEFSEWAVIEVLLVLIGYPGSKPTDIARRLQRRSPPIGLAVVHAVFSRYNLEEKGGPSIC